MNRPKTLAMLLILIAVVAALPLSAARMESFPTTVFQPDGSKLELFASGDEYHNWLHDKDNYTIIPNPGTGYYCYAELINSKLSPGSLIVGRDLPQSHNLNPGINITRDEYLQLRSTRFWAPETRNAPTTGTIQNLVIYIRFSDEAEFGENISTYDGWFNGSPLSMKTYFQAASYNQLTVNSNYYPLPAAGTVVSWQDSHPRSYYKPYNSSSAPDGYMDDDERRDREFTLLVNTVIGVRDQIPSSLIIDGDGDGRVDNVVFIVKGSTTAWSTLLWPHRWSIYDRVVNINGKRVYDFNFQLQNSLPSRGVGILCHEFFHSLGAPDLYHYDDGGLNIDPAGSWDIMESDKNPPQHMTAFMKYKYGHWIDEIPSISADGVYTLNPLSSSATGNAYKIASNNPNQYYVVEYRKKAPAGEFESLIPGSGMLIYRIDTTCGNGNADGPPDELYIYRPNGTTTVNGIIGSANFSIETGRTRIDNNSNPSPFLQDGSPGNLYLCEISSSAGETMTFRKGNPVIDFNINPYEQSFDATSFPPDGWTNQALVSTFSFERVASGTNPTCSTQSGAGMLRYNSDLAPSGAEAIFCSPRISISDYQSYTHTVSFWMYRDGNAYTQQDKLEIYLNSSADLSGSPILLGTIFRNRRLAPVVSIPGWYQYSFELPITTGGSYYAVFKAISANGYNIFVDSASFSRVLKSPELTISSTGSQISLSWNALPAATAYEVYASDDPNNWPDTPLQETSTHSIILSPTQARQFYRVIARN